MMGPSDRDRFIDELLSRDYVVACDIANSVRVHDRGVWVRVLGWLAAHPPSWDLAQDLAHQLEHAEIPPEAEPQLRELVALRNSELSGWALSKLIPLMSEGEIEATIEHLLQGDDIGWNEWNWAGYPLGQRIDTRLLPVLKDLLARAIYSELDGEEDAAQRRMVEARLFGFKSVIGGLNPQLLSDLLEWARRQRKSVRGVVVSGVSKVGLAEAEKFILHQFDLGLPEAMFTLYLRLEYGQPAWSLGLPRFTQRRFDLLTTNLATTSRMELRWRLSLLRTLARRDWRWWERLKQRARQETQRDVKRLLTGLIPGQERQILRRRIRKLLRLSVPPSPTDRALFDVHQDADPADLFSEADLLAAFEVNGPVVWQIIGGFLSSARRNAESKFSISEVDAWIGFVHSLNGSDPNNLSLDLAARFVAENLSPGARERVISRANTPDDSYSKFVLVEIFRRMSTVTTDNLTSEASQRLLHPFLSENTTAVLYRHRDR